MPSPSGAVRRPQSGAAHRREVGQRGAHEELGGDGVVADPEPGGDMTHEVHRHILPGGGASPAGGRRDATRGSEERPAERGGAQRAPAPTERETGDDVGEPVHREQHAGRGNRDRDAHRDAEQRRSRRAAAADPEHQGHRGVARGRVGGVTAGERRIDECRRRAHAGPCPLDEVLDLADQQPVAEPHRADEERQPHARLPDQLHQPDDDEDGAGDVAGAEARHRANKFDARSDRRGRRSTTRCRGRGRRRRCARSRSTRAARPRPPRRRPPECGRRRGLRTGWPAPQPTDGQDADDARRQEQHDDDDAPSSPLQPSLRHRPATARGRALGTLLANGRWRGCASRSQEPWCAARSSVWRPRRSPRTTTHRPRRTTRSTGC